MKSPIEKIIDILKIVKETVESDELIIEIEWYKTFKNIIILT